MRKLSLEKDVLNDTISKLREENQRLHIESQTASQQLRKLTEWFLNSNPVNSNEGNCMENSKLEVKQNLSSVSSSTNTTTISIQPTQTLNSTSDQKKT